MGTKRLSKRKPNGRHRRQNAGRHLKDAVNCTNTETIPRCSSKLPSTIRSTISESPGNKFSASPQSSSSEFEEYDSQSLPSLELQDAPVVPNIDIILNEKHSHNIDEVHPSNDGRRTNVDSTSRPQPTTTLYSLHEDTCNSNQTKNMQATKANSSIHIKKANDHLIKFKHDQEQQNPHVTGNTESPRVSNYIQSSQKLPKIEQLQSPQEKSRTNEAQKFHESDAVISNTPLELSSSVMNSSSSSPHSIGKETSQGPISCTSVSSNSIPNISTLFNSNISSPQSNYHANIPVSIYKNVSIPLILNLQSMTTRSIIVLPLESNTPTVTSPELQSTPRGNSTSSSHTTSPDSSEKQARIQEPNNLVPGKQLLCSQSQIATISHPKIHHEFSHPMAPIHNVVDPQSMPYPYPQNQHFNEDHEPKKVRRFRRRYNQIVRKYSCTYAGCNKSYGSLNHLNTHIVTKKHGHRKSKADYRKNFPEYFTENNANYRSPESISNYWYGYLQRPVGPYLPPVEGQPIAYISYLPPPGNPGQPQWAPQPSNYIPQPVSVVHSQVPQGPLQPQLHLHQVYPNGYPEVMRHVQQLPPPPLLPQPPHHQSLGVGLPHVQNVQNYQRPPT